MKQSSLDHLAVTHVKNLQNVADIDGVFIVLTTKSGKGTVSVHFDKAVGYNKLALAAAQALQRFAAVHGRRKPTALEAAEIAAKLGETPQ